MLEKDREGGRDFRFRLGLIYYASVVVCCAVCRKTNAHSYKYSWNVCYTCVYDACGDDARIDVCLFATAPVTIYTKINIRTGRT